MCVHNEKEDNMLSRSDMLEIMAKALQQAPTGDIRKLYQCMLGMGLLKNVEKEADHECKDQGVIC